MLSTAFRLSFWCCLALLILPIPTQNQSEAPQIGVIEALYAAKGVADDIKDICNRQPNACDIGGRAFETVKERAKVSAQGLAEYLDRAEDPTDAAVDSALTTGSIEKNPTTLGPAPIHDDAMDMTARPDELSVPVPTPRPTFP